MYSVYAGSTCIYDDTSNDKSLRLIAPTLELADSAAGSFKMTVPVTNAGYNLIERLKTYITVKKDGEEMWEGRVIDESIDFWKNRTLTCEGELAYLNDSTQPPAEYHDLTVRGFLETLIQIHNSKVSEERRFTVGAVTVTDPNDSLYRYTNYEKTIECINDKLVSRLGGHLVVRKENGVRYLDYLADKLSTNTQTIEFGTNLLDYTASFDMTEYATVVVPLGERLEESPISALEAYTTVASVNDGSIYVQNEEAVASYGWIEKVVHFDRVTQPANLLRKAQQYLSDLQFDNMILEVKAVDLHYMNPEIEGVKLSDQIRVISQPHGLNKVFPVMKLSIPLDQPENTLFTLGTKIQTSLTAENNKVNSEIKQRIEAMPTKQSVLDEARDNATEIMDLISNGYITITHGENGSEELYISDTQDLTQATRWWRWNVNGLAYYNTNMGSTSPVLAMTMDGSIVADRITTGTLRADLLDAVRIKASTFILENESDPTEPGETLQSAFQRFILSDQQLSSQIGGLTQVAVKKVEVYYALGNSQTQAPGDSANWSTTAPAWESGKYMWQKTLTIFADDTVATPHRSWSAATCIQGAKGENGDNGYNTAVVSLYKRSATPVTAIDWSGTLTYYFTGQNAHHLNSVPTGWSESIPSGDDPLYVTAATAYSNTGSDAIAATEWSAPIKMVENGSDGTPGRNYAIIYLYRRSASDPGAVSYSGNLTYTFSTDTLSSIPNGWYRSLNNLTGTDPIWITAASASSSADNDTIAASEWSAPIKMAQNGTNVATIFLYKRSSSVPTGASAKPSGALNYSFSSGELTPSTSYNGWLKEVPALSSNGYPCYVIQATALSINEADTIEVSEWSEPIKLLDSGTGINSVTVTYATSSSASVRPTTWSSDLPAVSEGEYLWIRTITDYTDESVDDTVTYTYSRQGTTGRSISISSIQYQSGTSATTAPTGTWSDTPVSVAAGNYLWTKTTYSNNSVAYSVAKQGNNGDSISISSIQYQSGTSATTAPTGTWSDTPVSVAAGNYLWTKTTFSDGNVAYGIARQGSNGAPGTPGYNSATVFLYQRSTSVPAKPVADSTYTFSNGELFSFKSDINVSDLVQGQWSYSTPDSRLTRARTKELIYVKAGTVLTYTVSSYDVFFGVLETPTSSTYTWSNGWRTASGTLTVGTDGWMTFVIRDHTNTSANVTPSAWNGTVSIDRTDWVQKIPATDGDPCYVIQATAVSVEATDTIPASEWSEIRMLVEDGSDGVGVSRIVPEYYLSTSASSPQGGSWTTTCPAWQSGKYIWTRSHVYYDNNTDSTTTPVLDNAVNGLGRSYTEIKQDMQSISLTASTDTTTEEVNVDAGSLVNAQFTPEDDSEVYQFEKNENRDWISTNAGVANSLSYGMVLFNFEEEMKVVLRCECHGEANFDYGIVSDLDVSLTVTRTRDSSGIKHSFESETGGTVVDLEYTIPSGAHRITFKYIKDSSTDGSGDYFKVHAYKVTEVITSATSKITLTGNGITAKSANIDLTGYVTFNDLLSEGQTIINGANIQTGTIEADRVKTKELWYNDHRILYGDSSHTSGAYMDLNNGIRDSTLGDILINYFATMFRFIDKDSTNDDEAFVIDAINKTLIPGGTSWNFGNSDNYLNRIYLGDRAYIWVDSNGDLNYTYGRNTYTLAPNV